MKKAKFSYKYTDKNDGDTIRVKVHVDKVDLTKDLGQKFIFIETVHYDGDRKIIQEISITAKNAKKLIKALEKVSK